jgi:PleD family two-component response regulator
MGATFTVSLPMRAALAGDNDAMIPRTSTARRPFEGLRVLVVDDEEDAREIVAVTLTLLEARVTQAESAAAALAALESNDGGGPFDVIVCDIVMPDEDGYSLLRNVRSLADDTAFIKERWKGLS